MRCLLRLSRLTLPALVGLLLPLAASRAADPLHLLDRFGPDGLPFTQDDPLAVGGFASEFRITAMAGDACSEEGALGDPPVKDRSGGAAGTHGHQNGHPPYDKTGRSLNLDSGKNHKTRPNPPEMLGNQVTEQPFDLTAWLAAVNLGDGGVSRMRIFPDDLQWLPVDGTVPGRDWGPGGSGLQDVWPSETKDLHLDGFGMSYRDIKNDGGLAMGIGKETWEKIGLKEFALDMAVQQVFIESFVLEMMNLETDKAALSGNYTMDLAGLQLFLDFDGMPETTVVNLDGEHWWSDAPGTGSCKASLNGVSVRLGDHVDPKYPFTKKPSDYFAEKRIPIILPKVNFTGTLDFSNWGGSSFECKDIWSSLMSVQEQPQVKWILDRLKSVGVDLEQLVIKAMMSSSGRIKSRLDYLDSLATTLKTKDYDQVSQYSGLAGPPQQGESDYFKTPFDRIALGTLRELGQFNPADWGPWLGVGDPPALKQIRGMRHLQGMDNGEMARDKFESIADGSLVTIEERMDDKGGWRYNGGATYLSKSAMIFGNSVGAKNQRETTYRGDPKLHFLYDPLEKFSDDARKQLPDLLKHYARWWIHPRLDLIDPYLGAEGERTAAWTSLDILFEHEPNDRTKSLRVDWPPPNYHFGRSQILAFRAGSGGIPNGGANPPYNVKTDEAFSFHGLASVDPLAGTVAIAATLTKAGNYSLNLSDSRVDKNKAFGWDEIWEIPTQDQIPTQNSSEIRWLTGGANHHSEADSEFEWRWDLDGDGAVDSRHLQQMASTGTYAWLFGYQTKSSAGTRGRTGFCLAPTTSQARDMLDKLAP